MFINLGNNNTVRSRNIISIVDYSVVTSSSILEEMIDEKKKQAKVTGVKSTAKSIIVAEDLIYYSSLSVPTLKKRTSLTSMVKKFERYSQEV